MQLKPFTVVVVQPKDKEISISNPQTVDNPINLGSRKYQTKPPHSTRICIVTGWKTLVQPDLVLSRKAMTVVLLSQLALFAIKTINCSDVSLMVLWLSILLRGYVYSVSMVPRMLMQESSFVRTDPNATQLQIWQLLWPCISPLWPYQPSPIPRRIGVSQWTYGTCYSRYLIPSNGSKTDQRMRSGRQTYLG